MAVLAPSNYLHVEWHLRAFMLLAFDHRRHQHGGRTHNLGLVVRDAKPKVSNEIRHDGLHFDHREAPAYTASHAAGECQYVPIHTQTNLRVVDAPVEEARRVPLRAGLRPTPPVNDCTPRCSA